MQQAGQVHFERRGPHGAGALAVHGDHRGFVHGGLEHGAHAAAAAAASGRYRGSFSQREIDGMAGLQHGRRHGHRALVGPLAGVELAAVQVRPGFERVQIHGRRAREGQRPAGRNVHRSRRRAGGRWRGRHAVLREHQHARFIRRQIQRDVRPALGFGDLSGDGIPPRAFQPLDAEDGLRCHRVVGRIRQEVDVRVIQLAVHHADFGRRGDIRRQRSMQRFAQLAFVLHQALGVPAFEHGARQLADLGRIGLGFLQARRQRRGAPRGNHRAALANPFVQFAKGG